MSAWKDEKRVSTLNVKDFRVVVHHHINYPPETWLFSVYGHISFENQTLTAVTLEDAKVETVRYLYKAIDRFSGLLQKASGS